MNLEYDFFLNKLQKKNFHDILIFEDAPVLS